MRSQRAAPTPEWSWSNDQLLHSLRSQGTVGQKCIRDPVKRILVVDHELLHFQIQLLSVRPIGTDAFENRPRLFVIGIFLNNVLNLKCSRPFRSPRRRSPLLDGQLHPGLPSRAVHRYCRADNQSLGSTPYQRGVPLVTDGRWSPRGCRSPSTRGVRARRGWRRPRRNPRLPEPRRAGQ